MNNPILLTDDDRPCRRALRDLLESRGYECKEAEDGREALALLDAGLRVDVIISDYHMPNMNGLSLLKALAKGTSTYKIPVILLSGQMTTEMERQTKQAGALAVMAKPCRSQELLALVSQACTRAVS